MHQCGYRTGDDGELEVRHHELRVGWGNEGRVSRNLITWFVFTPLRWMEQGVWYVIKPKGSDWVYELPE